MKDLGFKLGRLGGQLTFSKKFTKGEDWHILHFGIFESGNVKAIKVVLLFACIMIGWESK